MKNVFVITSILAAIAAVERSPAEKPAAEYPLLARLTLPKDSLPADCEIPDILEMPADEIPGIPADATPLKGLKNRSITTNPKAFLIGDERLKELIDAKQVEAMYLALYEEGNGPGNDVGVFGWAFKTENAARKTRKRLAASYANEPKRYGFWQVENYVVWLWRDTGVTDASFRQLETFIQEKVAAFKRKTKPTQ